VCRTSLSSDRVEPRATRLLKQMLADAWRSRLQSHDRLAQCVQKLIETGWPSPSPFLWSWGLTYSDAGVPRGPEAGRPDLRRIATSAAEPRMP